MHSGNVNDARKLGNAAEEAPCRHAVRHFEAGDSPEAVADTGCVYSPTVCRWIERHQHYGPGGLLTKPGKPSKYLLEELRGSAAIIQGRKPRQVCTPSLPWTRPIRRDRLCGERGARRLHPKSERVPIHSPGETVTRADYHGAGSSKRLVGDTGQFNEFLTGNGSPSHHPPDRKLKHLNDPLAPSFRSPYSPGIHRDKPAWSNVMPHPQRASVTAISGIERRVTSAPRSPDNAGPAPNLPPLPREPLYRRLTLASVSDS